MGNSEKEIARFLAFRMFIENIWLHVNSRINNRIPIYMIPYEKYQNNPYVKCIGDTCYWKRKPIIDTSMYDDEEKRQSFIFSWANDGKMGDMENLNKLIYHLNHPVYPHEIDYKCAKYKIMFFNLLSMMFDKDLYESELDTLIDLAYKLQFNDTMIYECTHAVKYILNVGHFDENCPSRNTFCAEHMFQGKYFFHGSLKYSSSVLGKAGCIIDDKDICVIL